MNEEGSFFSFLILSVHLKPFCNERYNKKGSQNKEKERKEKKIRGGC